MCSRFGFGLCEYFAEAFLKLFDCGRKDFRVTGTFRQEFLHSFSRAVQCFQHRLHPDPVILIQCVKLPSCSGRKRGGNGNRPESPFRKRIGQGGIIPFIRSRQKKQRTCCRKNRQNEKSRYSAASDRTPPLSRNIVPLKESIKKTPLRGLQEKTDSSFFHSASGLDERQSFCA